MAAVHKQDTVYSASKKNLLNQILIILLTLTTEWVYLIFLLHYLFRRLSCNHMASQRYWWTTTSQQKAYRKCYSRWDWLTMRTNPTPNVKSTTHTDAIPSCGVDSYKSLHLIWHSLLVELPDYLPFCAHFGPYIARCVRPNRRSAICMKKNINSRKKCTEQPHKKN